MDDTTIITLNSLNHGLYDVSSSALCDTIVKYSFFEANDLHREIVSLVGTEIDYSDLDRASALIVICYLSGGAV